MTADVNDLITERVNSAIDEYNLGADKTIELGIAPMNIILCCISNHPWEKVTELESNGWDSDYFITYYNPLTKKFIHITSSGYYGTARMSIISKDEVLDGLSYEEASEVEGEFITADEDFQNKLAELKKAYDANEEAFYNHMSKLDGLIKDLSKVLVE